MPTAEHLSQKLSGDKFYSKTDLSKGYWQITIPGGHTENGVCNN